MISFLFHRGQIMITHKIALNFEDGMTRFIECETIETVADALIVRGSIYRLTVGMAPAVPANAIAESGKYEMGFYIEDALDEDEVGLGMY